MSESDTVADFWDLFARRAGALATINSANDPVYDELLETLQGIDEGLFFEVSTQPGNCELIITADGDPSLFDLVDAIVAAGPRIKGWRYIALKPKVGFAESIEWDGYELAVADVVFDPLENEESAGLGLRLLVPGLPDDKADRAHNALLRVLDHALGERKFAEAVEYTEVAALDGPAEEYIPLLDLENFIEWRAKQ